MERADSDSSRVQQELQDSKDQNELLEFRILELEVRPTIVQFEISILLNIGKGLVTRALYIQHISQRCESVLWKKTLKA